MLDRYQSQNPLVKHSSGRDLIVDDNISTSKKLKRKYSKKKPVKTLKKNKKRIMATKRKKSTLVGTSGKMAKGDVHDPRFQFGLKATDWTLAASKQPLKNTEIIVLEPRTRVDKNGSYLTQPVEFDLPQNGQILLPGNRTRLYVKGIFEYKDGLAIPEWTAIPSTHGAKVIIPPNWFEKMIETMEIRGKNQSTQSLNKMPLFISPYINEMLYAHMDPSLKAMLCKEEAHPGHATTLTRSKWDFLGTAWGKYHPSIFKSGSFRFSYIPLDLWPFYQNGNFVLDEKNPPKAVDLSLFENGQIYIKWNEFAIQKMFKEVDDVNLRSYRIRITELKMAIEIGNPIQNDPFPKKFNLGYSGTTKVAESIVVSENFATASINNIKLPTSLLFFFLPKAVKGGNADYRLRTNFAGFNKHDLKHITVKFKDQELYKTDPSNKNAYLGLNDGANLEAHWLYPIAGIPVDRTKMTMKNLLDDGTEYAFPHIYLRLSPGSHQRLIPINGKISQIQEKGNLDIDMIFTDDQVIDKELMVVVCALYDDYLNVEADLRKKTYYNPILTSKNEELK